MTLSTVVKCIFVGLLVAIPAPFIVYSWLQTTAEINNLKVVIYMAAAVSAILGCLALGSSSAAGSKKPATASKRKAKTEDDQTDDDREEGVVKWFNVSKGFGFITRSSGEDIFVHYRSIRSGGRRTLSDGQQVRFVVTTGDKGLQAEDVSAVN